MIEAKAFRTFIIIYSLFKSERLSANIKLHRGTAVHVLSSRSFVMHAPKMVVGLQAVAGGIAE
jgi:hypothetical protein